MHYSANCLCGKVELGIDLPSPIENYAPRQCDCDFCQKYQLAYLSDPLGQLGIYSSAKFNQLKQGSGQATFWQCAECQQVIAVTYQAEKELRGAVNAQLFSANYGLPKAVVVSPKELSAIEKTQRWSTLWLTVNFTDLASD